MKSMVMGRSGGSPATGSVTAIWRRSGSTGRSTPTIAPTARDQAPAAQITVPVAIRPRLVTTRRDVVAAQFDAGDLGVPQDRRAVAAGVGGVAVDDGLGRAVAVLGREGGGEQAVGGDERGQPARLGRVGHAAGHAEGVLEPHALLEGGDLLRGRQQEQIADPVQPDVLPGLLLEAAERLQAARPEPDVELVGELRPHPARGLRGGAGGEFVALDEHHVPYSGARQVAGDARAHDSAADHDDVGRVRVHRRSPFAACTTAQAAAASWMPRPTLL